MEFVQFLGQDNVVRFVLLFGRMSGLVAFFPFFSHMKIPVVIKTALVFFFTIFLFPYAGDIAFEPSTLTLVFAFVSELMMGFVGGLLLFILFAALQLAGEQISFVMGFTMASVIDPQTGTNMPLIGQILTTLALVLFLTFDGHHLLILLYYHSLKAVPLGTFYPDSSLWTYISTGVINLFLFGFILSFPIKALSLLADVIFGMLMKTMPQFNLLVVGFPIKIMMAFVVLIAVLGAMMSVFKREILQILNNLPYILF